DAIIGNPPWGHAGILEAVEGMSRFDPVADDHAECFVCLAGGLIAPNGRIGMVLPDTILSPAKSKIRRHMLTHTRTTDCYNIGPDWFTAKIRMSTVLWLASGTHASLDDYSFDTCILPIALRRAAQAGQISLPNAIKRAKRQASARCCVGDPECGIPLFGDSDSIRVLDQAFHEALTLGDLCDHARGVELNKGGEVFRCPHCGKWDAPPRRAPDGSFRTKTCTHCGQEYRSGTPIQRRFLVSDLQVRGSEWKPYIDGDSIRRYSVPAVRYIDTSATGINYKPEGYYRSPKILIRQAGIGVNAILDVSSAFCPQSVYMYHVKDEYRALGIDESLMLSMVCSRLFHLQVFTTFGEIDSSRAFSKLTHKRLSRLCTVDPASMSASPELIQRIRSSVAVLTAHGLSGHEQEDWDIEACWTGLVGLSKDDVESVIRNFNHVHAGDTLLSLFPGGIDGQESYWVDTWRQAAARCGVTL
ncbi:MAG: TaqI-like C-terminal specificity domain-containing protein, partial [Planctomycetota bacterium]